MTLQLEYICTEAELKEAQSLNIQRQCGGGPRWRSLLVFWVLIVVIIAGIVLRFITEGMPGHPIMFIGLVAVVFVLLQYFKRATRRKRDEPTRVEVSEREIVFIASNGRSAMAWSAFSQCLESPALFVLLDKPKRVLITIPKRAFPDKQSQDWFRTLTKQLESPMTPPAGQTSMPGKFAGKGVALTVQWTYRDYLVHLITSWRNKGVALGFMGLFAGIFLFTPPPPHPVYSRGQVFLISAGTMVPIFTVFFLVFTLDSWRSQKKLHRPQQLALSSDGIQFADRDGAGLLAWSTYKYYLENRWAFFVWNPQGASWMMFPKREFASPIDIEQCRDLLRTNLKPSRWFFF